MPMLTSKANEQAHQTIPNPQLHVEHTFYFLFTSWVQNRQVWVQTHPKRLIIGYSSFQSESVQLFWRKAGVET